MAVFKCKICGGTLAINNSDSVAVCEYCGTKQTLPLFTNESEILLYDSGNNYLSLGEYDKAENVFNQLLTIKPDAAELYWDLVLCKYGVTHVKDPKTGSYVPTCNRTNYTPIFSDSNYKKAVNLANDEKRAFFEEDAKTIDNIQKGIIAVSKKEKPFDIFISYKETDANGNRSKDSIEAQKLYEKLTETGYKVFFSRITLEDKVGTEYEPYIYAALYSSKVMLTICSSRENIEAVWVRNEWSRYLSLQQNDTEKTIIPLYFDMDKSELPDEFLMIPSFDIKEKGFEAELIRGIKKQIPLPIMLAEKRKAQKKKLTIALSTLGVVLGICAVVFIPLAVRNIVQGNKYNDAMDLFNNQNYTEAKAIFETITSYEDAEYMVERCDRQPDYDKATAYYYNGEYGQAALAFNALKDYEDSAEMFKKAVDSWRRSQASVVTGNYDIGYYYITENGTVQLLNGEIGNAHSDVEIKKNGKVVSILSNNMYEFGQNNLITLHENGIVSHPSLDDGISKNPEWYDIVKISNSLGGFIVGLRADGKLIIAEAQGGMPKVMQNISSWSDLVDFQENYSGGNGYSFGLIIGLKSDGTLCVTQVPDYEDVPDATGGYDLLEVEYIINKFKNVKSFAFKETGYYGLEIVALTNDNKILTYSNGEFNEIIAENVCEIVNTDIVLMSNGDIVELETDKVLAHDVVYAGDGLVTRSGSVITVNYNYETSQYVVEHPGNKTIVYDEWVSRLE